MSAPDANGWMPIETAPKDGTPFLALNHDNEVWVARYDDIGRIQYRTNGRHEPRSFEIVKHNGEELLREDKAFAERNECWRSDWTIWSRLYEFKPIHWIPLPKPPVVGGCLMRTLSRRSRTAAPLSKRHHCGLDARQYGRRGRYQSADHHVFLATVKRLLLCVKSQAIEAVSQVFDVRQARDVGIRHDDRLGKHFDREHGVTPMVAERGLGHASQRRANQASALSTLALAHGYAFVSRETAA